MGDSSRGSRGAAAVLKVIAASAREDLRATGARGLDYALCNLTRDANFPKMIQLLMGLQKQAGLAAAPGHSVEHIG